jgi:hypothetical protein
MPRVAATVAAPIAPIARVGLIAEVALLASVELLAQRAREPGVRSRWRRCWR